MTTATFNGVVIAESDETVVVEGNHYFPRASVKAEALGASDHETFCGWKGTASYHSVTANGETADNAAWYYTEPLPKATEITDYVAFYGSKVQVD